jgi:hypothetical protein
MLKTNTVRCVHTPRGRLGLYSRSCPCERSGHHVRASSHCSPPALIPTQICSITCNDRDSLEGLYYSALDPLPNTSSTVPDLVNENALLRARIDQLEALVAISKDEGHSPISTSRANDTPFGPRPPEDIVTAFEGLHLGDPVKEWSKYSTLQPEGLTRHVLSLLPIRQSSVKIVRFSLAALGWVHCALNGPRFLAEHDAFWNRLEVNDRNALENHGWMAVYFGVLAVSYLKKSIYPMLTVQGWCIFHG